jgi:hypothetical protein
MSGTQLITAVEDENREIAIEPIGTGLAPTVQVSLAKRIIHPGTNKVVCLAAKTTVPMEEDELASVSDLALRLSDGTNVQLSMSFFNDELCPAGFAPPKKSRPLYQPPIYETFKSTYDPDRYETYRAPDTSWRLWFVFAGICAVSIGSFLYFIPGGFEKSAAQIVAALPPIAMPNAHFAPPLHKTIAPQSKPIKKNSPAETRKPKHSYSIAKGQHSSYRSARRSSHNSDIAEYKVPRISEYKAPRGGSKSILIPPPPPTAIPISQMQQMFNFSPYAIPDINGQDMKTSQPAGKLSSKPKSSKPPVMKQTAPFDGSLFMSPAYGATSSTNLGPNAIANSNAKQLQSALKPMPARSSRSEAHRMAEPQQSSYSALTESTEQPSTARNTGGRKAPEPGSNSSDGEQPQLERIVIP